MRLPGRTATAARSPRSRPAGTPVARTPDQAQAALGEAPDEVARRRVAAVRGYLGITSWEFAEVVEGILAWPVTSEDVEAWEHDATPPVDVLRAVELAAKRAVEADRRLMAQDGVTVPRVDPLAGAGSWAQLTPR